MEDLSILDLGSYRATQSINGWHIQLATSLDYLREAHPGPLLQRYVHCKIGEFLPGTDLGEIFKVLKADRAMVSSVFLFYMERGFLKSRDDDTPPGDHLVCVYPHQRPPPAIFGSEALRALCIPGLFGIKDTGQLTPGWGRVREFYSEIVRLPDDVLDRQLNKQYGDVDREGFRLVTKNQSSQLSAAATRQIGQLEAASRKEFARIDKQLRDLRSSQLTRQDVGLLTQTALSPLEERVQRVESTAVTKVEVQQAFSSFQEMVQMQQLMIDSMHARLREYGIAVGPPQVPYVNAAGAPTVAMEHEYGEDDSPPDPLQR